MTHLVDQETETRAVAQLRKGTPFQFISDMFGVSQGYIRKMREKYNIKKRDKSRAWRSYI